MQWNNEDKVLSRFLSAICVQAHQDMVDLKETGRYHYMKEKRVKNVEIARLYVFYFDEMPKIVKGFHVAGIS